MKSRRPLQSFRRDSETATTTCTAFLHQRTKPTQSLCNQNRLRGCTGCRLGEGATPRNPKRCGWSNRRAAETPTHRNQGSQQARAASESAPSGFSKRVYEGHGSSRSHNICPPTHINRVRLCPRWCSLAKCRNIKGNEATMADVRDRCCGSPTASCKLFRHAVKEASG